MPATADSAPPVQRRSGSRPPLIRPLADATARGDHRNFHRTSRLTSGIGTGIALLAAACGWLLGAGSRAAVVAQNRWVARTRASVAGLVGFGLTLPHLPEKPTLVAAMAGLVGIGLIVAVMMSHVTGESTVPGQPIQNS